MLILKFEYTVNQTIYPLYKPFKCDTMFKWKNRGNIGEVEYIVHREHSFIGKTSQY